MSDRTPLLERRLGVPEEIGFFVRGAIFGIVTVIVYWFMTYEVAGTVLLGVFGAASAAIALYLYYLYRRVRSEPAHTVEPGSWPPPADGPFADDTGLAPNPILAPLEIAFGATLFLLAIPFGLWMALIAIFPFAAGALAWLDAAMEEQRFVIDREVDENHSDAAPQTRSLAEPGSRDPQTESDKSVALRAGVLGAGAAGAFLLTSTRAGKRVLMALVGVLARLVALALATVVGAAAEQHEKDD